MPLPQPAPWTEPLPAAAPPAELALYRLPTGTYRTRAAFAFRGGSWRDKRDFAATAVLVCHPQGDLLIDAGFGAGVAEHVKAQPRIARAPISAGASARRQLSGAGYDLDKLRGVVLTHAHWDHVSGLDELPVPIWINDLELRSARETSDGAVFRQVSQGHQIDQYAMDGPPYLGFARSYDVYGDGSVVIALAGGHTPGSVVVFVTMPSAERYAFIGDITWQLEGITQRAERRWLLSKMADDEPDVVRDGLSRVISLAEVMRVVPAHDRAAFDTIPTLTSLPAGTM